MKDFLIHTVSALAFILSIAASRDVLAYSAIGPACTGGSATQKVSFVHVGDMHARFDPVEDSYSRVRAFLNKVRLENPYTIFTNAGDDHEKGSVAEQYSSGNAVTEATFAMQFDVRTIGNHDFAWGVDHLLAYSRDPHSMVLSSNTRYDGADARGLGSVDYGVLEVGCLRIGFFGMVGMPWNELDEQVPQDYLPSLHTTFDYSELAGKIVDAHRGEVDLMVMVSHLGSAEDEKVAANVNGLDLVLGGHSHDPPKQQIINNTLVIQPSIYASGVTRVDLNVNLATRSVSSFSYQEQLVWQLTEIDSTIHQAIGDILTKYAPNAQQPVSYLERSQDQNGRAAIAAIAGRNRYAADAALLDPARANPNLTWPSGKVTPQNLLDGYFIERQPSNTPGINALYMVEVSGEGLQLMKGQQPAWIYSGLLTPNAGSRYKVIIHKGAALNPSLFFPGVNFLSVVFLSETWEVLAKYGADRTAACLFLDTDSPLSIPSCRPGGGGGGSDGGGGCFIATAAYGSDLDPYVTILRNFRDAFLLTNPLGKSFIAWYYKVSPPIADSVRTSETAKAFVRIILLPAVGFVYLCLNAGIVPGLLIIIFAIAIIWVGIRRIYRFSCTLLYNIILL